MLIIKLLIIVIKIYLYSSAIGGETLKIQKIINNPKKSFILLYRYNCYKKRGCRTQGTTTPKNLNFLCFYDFKPNQQPQPPLQPLSQPQPQPLLALKPQPPQQNKMRMRIIIHQQPPIPQPFIKTTPL